MFVTTNEKETQEKSGGVRVGCSGWENVGSNAASECGNKLSFRYFMSSIFFDRMKSPARIR